VLSEPGGYDPAADIAARYPGWRVAETTLGWGIREVMCRRSRVILLERAGPLEERRCSLAHAIAHLDLGHGPVSGLFDVRQEAEASRLAALRLVPMERLAELVGWARSEQELALELGVDHATLRTRLAALGAAQLAHLRAGLPTEAA
jgi:hypothetical protein